MPERARRRAERPEAAHGPRAFWSGTISFGLVNVPVDLWPAHRPGRPSLRLLAPDGTPLARRYVCPKDDAEVPPEHLVRGYEVAPEEHVVVTDEELEALEPRKSREIDLVRFVPVDEVDPRYFQRAYFLTPAGDSTKAYRLLAAVMEDTGRAGIATFVLRGHEYLVAILAEGGILRAETLRFADELRDAEEVGLPEPPKVPKKDVDRFAKAIDALTEKELDRDELVDEATRRQALLARRKDRRGEDVVEVAAPPEEGGEVVDLLDVIRKSLREGGKKRADAGAKKQAAAGGKKRAGAGAKKRAKRA